jgi:hypothetical protein
VIYVILLLKEGIAVSSTTLVGIIKQVNKEGNQNAQYNIETVFTSIHVSLYHMYEIETLQVTIKIARNFP